MLDYMRALSDGKAKERARKRAYNGSQEKKKMENMSLEGLAKGKEMKTTNLQAASCRLSPLRSLIEAFGCLAKSEAMDTLTVANLKPKPYSPSVKRKEITVLCAYDDD